MAINEPKVRQVSLQQMAWERVACVLWAYVQFLQVLRETRQTFPHRNGGYWEACGNEGHCKLQLLELCGCSVTKLTYPYKNYKLTKNYKYLMQNLPLLGEKGRQIQNFKKCSIQYHSQTHELLYQISPAVSTDLLVCNCHFVDNHS